MRTRTVAVSLAIAIVGTLAAAPSAEAIPAFARKYRFSCSTCHAPIPRLKEFGDEFAGAGFRMPDAAQEPPRATLDTGDALLRLPRDLPLAVRLDGFAAWNEQGDAKVDAQFPWVFKILSGGPISEKVSYYFYFILEEGGIQGLEDAYVQINKPLGLPFNLMAGQFQVCDPLFKRELRLSRFDYQIFKTRVGHSRVDLTYDRGLIAAGTLPEDIDAVLQVVNGTGIGEATDWGTFDRDNYKNVALSLARSFGKHVRLGVFGYWGREKGDGGNTNRTVYVGPNLAVDLGAKWQLSGQYLERRDDDPLFGGGGSDYVTRGGFAELHYFPQGQDGRWVVTALYNKVASDDPDARYHSVSLTVNRLIARNVRLAIEAGRELERDEGRASIGLVMAF
jgi:hypothetical protein